MHSFFLAVILSIAPSTTSAQPADCADGKQAVERKKYAEGLTRLKSCLGGNLSNEQRLLFLQVRAKAYHGLNQMSLAIEDQERAVTIDSSNDAWPWIRLSIYQREDRHFGKALIAIGQAENRDESAAGSGPGWPFQP